MTALSRKSLKNLVACLTYYLVNLTLFVLFIREALIVRADGPGGFGEVILKLLMSQMALAVLVMGLIASIKVFCTDKRGWGSITASAVATLALVGFAAIAVTEACVDDRGYCRDWQWHSSLT
ncbi:MULTISPECIES: hypothetical protein [unclassified Pseudomonas]|uniref:hypothetical protein n=1 Tax=unclassified Pseudomonas TaxID=196821 RepID=UPI0035C1BABD